MVEELAHKICPACEQRVLDGPRFCPNCAADLSEVETQVGDPYEGLEIDGRYRLESCIGVGAMGRVYRATQTSLGKSFAAKILHPHLTHDAESHERFANEAHNSSGLNHPNVVSVVDYGRTNAGVTYLMMEYIEGQSLEDIICHEWPLSRARVIDLTLQILAALTEAHGLGILHRDLKPENILVQSLRTRGELLKVLDFGIAKLMDGPENKRPGLTSAGIVCGTPEYMSPEQARGHQLDGRSDLYAAGVILYRMLCGHLPFAGESAVELLHRHIHEAPRHPAEVAGRAPDALDELALKALSKDREERFATAQEFRDALVAASREAAAAAACSNCRGPLRSTDRFCANCGTPVPPPESQPPVTETPQRTRGSLRVGAQATTSRLAQRFPLPTIGREQWIERGRSWLARGDAGVRNYALRGPSGAGKSRALDDFLRLANNEGWQVVRASAEPSGAAPPLWPVRDAIRKVLSLPAEVTTRDLGRASNLAGLSFEALPGLAELFGLSGPLADAEFAVRRRECFVAAAQTLVNAGRGAKLVLAFDDIEQYDTSSRRVLQALRHQPVNAPVLVMVCSQEEELDWLEAEVVSLGPMAREDIEAAARFVCTGEEGRLAEFVPHMRKLEQPTALEVENALRLLAHDEPLGDSPRLGKLLDARLQGLGPAERAVLEAASVLGTRCLERQLRAIVAAARGPEGDALDDVLASLHMQDLLPLGEPGHRRFAHAELQRHVYRSLKPDLMQSLHAAAAALHNDGDPIIAAMHRLRAGESKLAESLQKAADCAVAAFDDRKSASLLKAALRVLETERDVEIDVRVDLTTRAAYALCYARKPDVALTKLDELLAGAKAGTYTLTTPHQAEIGRARGFALSRLHRHSEAAREYAQLAGAALVLGKPETLLSAHADYAQALAQAGDLDGARRELEQGIDMATMGGGPRAEVEFPMWRHLLAVADICHRQGDARGSLQYCRHAVWRAERIDDPLSRMRAHTDLARAFARVGQATRGEQHRSRAISLSREFGDRKTTAELLLERASFKLALPRPDEAKACAESALALAEVLEWHAGASEARAIVESARAAGAR